MVSISLMRTKAIGDRMLIDKEFKTITNIIKEGEIGILLKGIPDLIHKRV